MAKNIKFYVCIVLLALCWMPLFAYASQSNLTGLRILQINKNSRLVFTSNKPLQYNCFTLIKPDRLIVDFTDTKLAFPIHKLTFNHALIKTIRTGIQPNHRLRVVLELAQQFDPKPYTLKPHGHYGHRLIIDLMPIKKKYIIRASRKRKIIKSANNSKKLRNVVVVIDPGHGGKDPGATGQLGTHEKDVVLAIGKDLYRLLKKQPGIDPRLTRKGDYFVPLRGRLHLARKGWADIFIAIHADAFLNHNSRGASIFALSQHGATSEAARWLAKKENYSELMGGVNLEDKSYLLRSVLIDLSQTATIRESLALGNYVMHAVTKIARLHAHHVEQAPFVVLKSPDIPSLLVETGFISTRKEELLLRNPAYQQKMARALMQGILNYLHKYPPPGTVLTKVHQGTQRHIVRRGETLTAIAQHYGTNIVTLKHINNLTTTALNIGQAIQIPRTS